MYHSFRGGTKVGGVSRAVNRESNTQRPNEAAAVQTERVFKWWDYPLFTLLSFVNLTAVAYFGSHWVSLKDWRSHPAVLWVLTLILLVVSINYFGRWFLLPLMRKPKPRPARVGWKIAVATSFVPGAEPLEMLRETLKALVSLDYPHDTWVLDEGDSEQVKTLCQELGVKHFSRKSLLAYQAQSGRFQSGSKHGNYNAWFYSFGLNNYDIITVFDPDHVPVPAFLSRVIGFFDDPSIAYVQVAQAYYNQKASFIARGAAEETYAYYSSVQMASYRYGLSDHYRVP